MRRISPLTLLFFLVSCNSAAQEQVVSGASDTIPSAKVTLLFVGDLMQHNAQLEAARTSQGTHDYSLCFSLVKEQISRADIAIGNLEVTLGGKPYAGYPAFSAPDEFFICYSRCWIRHTINCKQSLSGSRKEGAGTYYPDVGFFTYSIYRHLSE